MAKNKLGIMMVLHNVTKEEADGFCEHVIRSKQKYAPDANGRTWVGRHSDVQTYLEKGNRLCIGRKEE